MLVYDKVTGQKHRVFSIERASSHGTNDIFTETLFLIETEDGWEWQNANKFTAEKPQDPDEDVELTNTLLDLLSTGEWTKRALAKELKISRDKTSRLLEELGNKIEVSRHSTPGLPDVVRLRTPKEI